MLIAIIIFITAIMCFNRSLAVRARMSPAWAEDPLYPTAAWEPGVADGPSFAVRVRSMQFALHFDMCTEFSFATVYTQTPAPTHEYYVVTGVVTGGESNRCMITLHLLFALRAVGGGFFLLPVFCPWATLHKRETSVASAIGVY